MSNNKINKCLCPVCGEFYFTNLTQEEFERDKMINDEFCFNCGWVYDEKQIIDANIVTELNKLSLNEYKKMYESKKLANPNYYYLDEIKTEPKPHKCPVCGKYDFVDELSYDICPYCGWEDDGFDDDNFINDISACGSTFIEYKKNYENTIKINPLYVWKNKND